MLNSCASKLGFDKVAPFDEVACNAGYACLCSFGAILYSSYSLVIAGWCAVRSGMCAWPLTHVIARLCTVNRLHDPCADSGSAVRQSLHPSNQCACNDHNCDSAAGDSEIVCFSDEWMDLRRPREHIWHVHLVMHGKYTAHSHTESR